MSDVYRDNLYCQAQYSTKYNIIIIMGNTHEPFSNMLHADFSSHLRTPSGRHEASVLIKEVSLFQREFCTCFYVAGTSGSVLIREMSLFQRSLIERFHCILVIIIILCRRFVLFTWLFGRNVVEVLAALVFLMCSPLSYAILQTFQCTPLHISTPNESKVRLIWYNDGNVPCFGAKHIPLFIIRILCALALCFFTFSLLLVQCLQRRANLICFRWVEKLQPFLTLSLVLACQDNYRF